MRFSTITDLAADFGLSLGLALRDSSSFRNVERFVIFVGASRSGHSVVGSLLNAHENVVISHELNAVRYVAAGFRRQQLYSLILRADKRFEERGRTTKRQYNYSVPDNWQGRFSDLRVIGDKEGSGASSLLHRRPELLDRLRRTVGVPVHVIHVIRNPFDNIATISLRQDKTLEAAADRYFQVCEAVASIKAACPRSQWLDLRHEELVADSEGAVRALCEFLSVPADEGYVRNCASIVYARPHRSRDEVSWSPTLLEEVEKRMSSYQFLDGYGYTELGNPEEAAPETPGPEVRPTAEA